MPFTVPAPPPKAIHPLVSPRGSRLATRIWRPTSSRIRAICLLVHGCGFHSGYFEGLAGRLNREGVLCIAYDQVCMGYSDPEFDAPTGYIHVKEFAYWIEDLFAAADWAKQQCSSKPMFLLGEGFGGLQVLAAALDRKLQEHYGIQVSGVITLNAQLQMGPLQTPSSIVRMLLSFLEPCYPRVQMMNYQLPLAEAFANKEWARTAQEDPAVRKSLLLTLSVALSMLVEGERVAAQAKSLEVPLLAIHARRDSRTDFEAVQKFVDQAGSKAEWLWIDNTTGHRLLQDYKEVTELVKNKVAEWIVRQAP